MSQQSFFIDARVRFVQEGDGRQYLRMTLRSGYQHFYCDIVQLDERGLRRCEHIAQALSLPLYLTDEARAALHGNSAKLSREALDALSPAQRDALARWGARVGNDWCAKLLQAWTCSGRGIAHYSSELEEISQGPVRDLIENIRTHDLVVHYEHMQREGRA